MLPAVACVAAGVAVRVDAERPVAAVRIVHRAYYRGPARRFHCRREVPDPDPGGDRARPARRPLRHLGVGARIHIVPGGHGVLAAAKQFGLSGTSLTGFIQSLALNSPATVGKGILTGMLANISSAAVIQDECVKLGEVVNMPNGVLELIPALEAAATPEARIEVIRDMQTALGN